MAACTRANPDAVGGNGGSGGGGTAGSGGAGGGGTGGGGGTAGGGGTGGGQDLAMSGAADMSKLPPDMATLQGVACGMTSCMNGEDCCINNNGEHCTTQNSCSGGAHPTLWACDGPEDCKSTVSPVCCANSSGSACDPSCTGLGTPATPMCHSLADCPPLDGYTACCPIQALPQYSVCSKTAC